MAWFLKANSQVQQKLKFGRASAYSVLKDIKDGKDISPRTERVEILDIWEIMIRRFWRIVAVHGFIETNKLLDKTDDLNCEYRKFYSKAIHHTYEVLSQRKDKESSSDRAMLQALSPKAPAMYITEKLGWMPFDIFVTGGPGVVCTDETEEPNRTGGIVDEY